MNSVLHASLFVYPAGMVLHSLQGNKKKITDFAIGFYLADQGDSIALSPGNIIFLQKPEFGVARVFSDFFQAGECAYKNFDINKIEAVKSQSGSKNCD